MACYPGPLCSILGPNAAAGIRISIELQPEVIGTMVLYKTGACDDSQNWQK
jgi:hypothetical protein